MTLAGTAAATWPKLGLVMFPLTVAIYGVHFDVYAKLFSNDANLDKSEILDLQRLP
jgi:hypothetical protein